MAGRDVAQFSLEYENSSYLSPRARLARVRRQCECGAYLRRGSLPILVRARTDRSALEHRSVLQETLTDSHAVAFLSGQRRAMTALSHKASLRQSGIGGCNRCRADLQRSSLPIFKPAQPAHPPTASCNAACASPASSPSPCPCWCRPWHLNARCPCHSVG